MYSTARKRLKKYYQKIFRHLLDLTVFNSFVIYRKHGGISMHLQLIPYGNNLKVLPEVQRSNSP
jgi:hypothetical protein